ncbi:hypothetical protein PM082_004738 [Marasmius tenuissimus]|nr:hypothetical protein PM082_004738 [Marasmius tenuissimus]
MLAHLCAAGEGWYSGEEKELGADGCRHRPNLKANKTTHGRRETPKPASSANNRLLRGSRDRTALARHQGNDTHVAPLRPRVRSKSTDRLDAGAGKSSSFVDPLVLRKQESAANYSTTTSYNIPATSLSHPLPLQEKLSPNGLPKTSRIGAYVTAGNNPPLNLHFNASALGLDFGDEGGGGGVIKKEWSSSRDGFHAILTVLNNLHKKQAPPKAHSSLGGAAVGPAELPRVRRTDFDGYLRAVGDEWERFRGPTAMTTTTDDSDQPTPLPGNLPPLETIPSIFFDTSFDLSDPKTFASVSESEDPTSLSHSLQIHLSHEISLRSSSFFTALSNLQLFLVN